jgi:hypothetical protein
MVYHTRGEPVNHFVTVYGREIHYIRFNIFPSGVQCVWCFSISISGETYIEAGVPYMVTCNVSHFLDIRETTYSAKIEDNDPFFFVIANPTTSSCYYQDSTGDFTVCTNSLCSCDTDGLTTHWIYNTPADLSSTVTFRCTSADNDGKFHNSGPWKPTVPCKC